MSGRRGSSFVLVELVEFVLTVALASLIFGSDVQVKRRRGSAAEFHDAARAHEAGMIWGSGAFRQRRVASRGLLRAAFLATAGLVALGAGAVRAETIGGALIKAYLTNPDINTQRAAVRAADENVPKANAGYLPTVTAQGNYSLEREQANEIGPNGPVSNTITSSLFPRGYGVTVNETVFNGMRTTNSISQ